ncbi:hypothetical protein MCA1972 [Methylococcus capsulatus str. Bath]|uniref:Uncharacterized protein n=1 Tax=Methylococcus capsulatus (strain ATCC 33009 / NCIMB 11132 / Bath) TaxID=243233 RepID=Q606P4_METCA|nr:hypothetical protein MCA1972 [Methylococcus capsulatus str. Bath]
MPATRQVAGSFAPSVRLESALANLSETYDFHHAVTWPALAYGATNPNRGE